MRVDSERSGNWVLEAQVASTVQPNDVTFALNGSIVGRQVVDWPSFRAVSPLVLSLNAGPNTLRVISGAPPQVIGTDPRRLAVAVRNLTLTQQAGSIGCDVSR